MRKNYSLVMIFLVFLLAPSGAAQAPGLFMERALLRAADSVCEFFHEGEKQALDAGYWQSYGALLRAGKSKQALAQFEEKAQALAQQYGCQHGKLAELAERLRHAFVAFLRISHMQYPSDHAVWLASRRSGKGWKLAQRHHNLRFGLFSDSGEATGNVAVEVSIPERDYADVRLLLRDPKRLNRPWIGDILGRESFLRAPPLAILQTFWANGRQITDEGNVIWRFPQSAQKALSLLDPREAILLEFRSSDPDATPRQAVFEIGDFQAGQAFVSIRSPPQPSGP